MNCTENKIFPSEIWFNIFSFLDERDLTSLELVSKEFRAIAKDPYLWKEFVYKRKIDIISSIDKSMKEIVLDSVKLYIHTMSPIVQILHKEEKPKDLYLVYPENAFEVESLIVNYLINSEKKSSEKLKNILASALLDEDNIRNYQKLNILIDNGADINDDAINVMVNKNIPNETFIFMVETVKHRELEKIGFYSLSPAELENLREGMSQVKQDLIKIKFPD